MNPRNPQFGDYGGRGITICERWESFENFLADMGEGPSNKSIDRIDNNGNYEPGNCRWATQSEQSRNRRSTHLLTHEGVTLSLIEWSERSGINLATLLTRIKHGWSPADALQRKPRPQRHFTSDEISMILEMPGSLSEIGRQLNIHHTRIARIKKARV